MSPRIRVLTLDDTTEVLRLTHQLGHAPTEASVAAALEAIAGDETAIGFGAAGGEGLRGWIHAHESRPLQAPPFVKIAGLVVDESDTWRRPTMR